MLGRSWALWGQHRSILGPLGANMEAMIALSGGKSENRDALGRGRGGVNPSPGEKGLDLLDLFLHL